MQTTFVLELEFAQQTYFTQMADNPTKSTNIAIRNYSINHGYELRAYIMYDKVIAFDETSGSICSEYEVFFNVHIFFSKIVNETVHLNYAIQVNLHVWFPQLDYHLVTLHLN